MCIYCGNHLPQESKVEQSSKTTFDLQNATRLLEEIKKYETGILAINSANELLKLLVVELNKVKIKTIELPPDMFSPDVLTSGIALMHVCDAAVEELEVRGLIVESEKASRLAIGFAGQILGHYPQDVFPLVYRNGQLCEKITKTETAISRYMAIIRDFKQMGLIESILNNGSSLNESDRIILETVKSSIDRINTLQSSPDDDLIELSNKIVGKLV